MIKYVCDHCGKEIDHYDRFLIAYSCGEEVELCKECNEEFLNWMNNKPIKDYEKKIEDYQRAIHNYQQQIINLTEKLDKARVNNEWWSNQCNEIAGQYNALHKKMDEIRVLGALSLESPDPENKIEDLYKLIDMPFEEYQAMLKELVQELMKADYPGFKGE